jgi:FkbM family methyltransferase
MVRHIEEILKGEYDLSYSRYAPVIIDIGANIGGFAVWASQRWRDATIHCYEPVLANFELLQKNVQRFPSCRALLNNFAIGAPHRTTMFLGKNNCGEASFFELGEQSTEMVNVRTKDASVLPPAHILKVDTEGSEIEILEQHRSIDYEVILIEFHGETKRRRVDEILHNYCLIGAKIRHPHRGILKYIHHTLVSPEFAKYENAT